MAKGTVDVHDDPGFGTGVLAALRRAVGRRSRNRLVVATMVVGLGAAVVLTAVTPPAERTLAAVAEPVQSLMSILVPLITILLVRDLRRAPGPPAVLPTLVAAPLLGAFIGLMGGLVCSIAIAVSDAAPGAWRHAGTILVGGVLVQVVASLVGTGLGLLLSPAVVAFLATIVLPIGLYAGLGAVPALEPARAWLTPYAIVKPLLTGEMSPPNWAQWCSVFLLWGVALNTAGVARLRRHDSSRAA
jgi:hypothetical protein